MNAERRLVQKYLKLGGTLAQGCFSILALCHFQSKGFEGCVNLVGGGGERSEGAEKPLILRVELAALIVGDGPDGADGFAFDVKGNEQAFLDRRSDGLEIGVTPFKVSEQERYVAIQHVAAGAEIARRAAADVGFPYAGNGRPVEALSAVVGRKETEAGRVGLKNLKDGIGQHLKNRTRGLGQGMGQAHESAVLLLVIGRTRRATMQFLCAQNRFQRDSALRNGNHAAIASLRDGRFGHVFTAVRNRCGVRLLRCLKLKDEIDGHLMLAGTLAIYRIDCTGMASNSRKDKLKRRPYSYGKSAEADEARRGHCCAVPLQRRDAPLAWARLPAACRLKRRAYRSGDDKSSQLLERCMVSACFVRHQTWF